MENKTLFAYVPVTYVAADIFVTSIKICFIETGVLAVI